MSKTKSGLPLTISLDIPTCRTPEQASAVFEVVDDLREAIWRCYAIELQDQHRNQIQPPNDDPDKQPF
jgi:hypothetical protein